MSHSACSDATEGAGKDWATAIKRMSIQGLPVVHHVAVLANQVRSHFGNGGGTGLARPSVMGSPRPMMPSSV